jgi:hypothetical protein
VAQLYPQALGTHFSRLLRHAWVTVGLFFNPGHHTGLTNTMTQIISLKVHRHSVKTFSALRNPNEVKNVDRMQTLTL